MPFAHDPGYYWRDQCLFASSARPVILTIMIGGTDLYGGPVTIEARPTLTSIKLESYEYPPEIPLQRFGR